jgi:tetratricopeptide (TPR) repeat protein
MLVAAYLIGAVLAAEPEPPAWITSLAEAEKQFQAGVQARERPDQARAHFAAAFALYERLREQGADNADLYRNQGNAALLAADLPSAILAYRRGLQLAPANGLLEEGLEYARDQVEYPRRELRQTADDWPSWLLRPSDPLLLGLTVFFYALGCVALTRWLMIRRRLLLCYAGLALLVAVALGLVWQTRQRQQEQGRTHPLVVVKEATPLRTGNGGAYPPHQGLPSVRRGMEGGLQFARGAWLQVEFSGGFLGWLPRDRVLLDTP